ncbi:MAG: hypothetical protein ACYDHY_07435 [Acidiferrobacterales bacterium]
MMEGILLVLLALSFTANILLAIALVRAARNLLMFDDLFDLLQRDIRDNLNYLDKVNNTPLLSNLPEVMDMSRNFNIIQSRISEFLIRIEETRRRLPPAKETTNDQERK